MVKDKNYNRSFIWKTKHNRIFQNSYQVPSLIRYLPAVLASLMERTVFHQKTKQNKKTPSISTLR